MQWDELRRQARTLESDLDANLTSLGKLGSAGGALKHTRGAKCEQTPDFNNLCRDIEDLLERFVFISSVMFMHHVTESSCITLHFNALILVINALKTGCFVILLAHYVHVG